MSTSRKSIKSLAEGILNYYVFLTKCGVATSISEHTLYEPLFRMLNKNKEIMVSCEFPVDLEKTTKGDKKRIDFVIQKHIPRKKSSVKEISIYESKIQFAIELKLLKKASKSYGKRAFENDTEKLLKLQNKQKSKFGKFIFAIYKTNRETESIFGSNEDLNVTLNCVDATYKLDVIEVH
ncbi:MAG: hypothetical protein RLY35_1468 [Bacteroidota bacterium]|jgi:hypothetical protein